MSGFEALCLIGAMLISCCALFATLSDHPWRVVCVCSGLALALVGVAITSAILRFGGVS